MVVSATRWNKTGSQIHLSKKQSFEPRQDLLTQISRLHSAPTAYLDLSGTGTGSASTSVVHTLTRVGAPQFPGFLLSDLSAPPVGVLVGVQLEEQHRVDSQGDDAAD